MTTLPARKELPPAYEPATVEGRIYQFWEEQGYFQPRIDPAQKPYTIIMPPPNVTGELHLGHGLEDAITDALVRWHRMQGEPTLWLPGEDHAGIATQNVIERELAKEGLSRHDLGREGFVERTWMWVRKYRSRIADQHRKLGASADWSRDVFTLDPGIVKAVRTTFVNLYRDGLIYRGLRMINWCPRCETALSDLEVDYVDVASKLYYVRYPLVGEGGMPLPAYVVVATTRPETMVADTGVAVNPADERYEEKIGRMLLLPIIGREIPIVADDAVKTEFGTGAVKVTPGHDPNDWEIGQRHNLEVIIAMDRQARMNDEAGPYTGMTDEEARAAILHDLEDEGFLDHIEEYTHSVGHCSRCKSVLQPIPSEQWWIDVRREYEPGRSLAGEAAKAVREGRIRIVPQRFEKVYLNWMDNIRDWCISRQLWWGHQIPVWYCPDGHMTVVVEDPGACAQCGSTALRQDEDVLDTWFSSGLAPHADLGWPGDTEDLRYFYPTGDMQMGYDIMFFWCARMVMFALYNMRHLGPENEVPFRTVLFHGLIRDANNEKMTKSRGNVVDPLVAAAQYGADAFRFAVLTGAAMGADQRYQDERMAAARNFANKLWNSARYVLMKLESRSVGRPHPRDRDAFAIEDRWILSQLTDTVVSVTDSIERYRFHEATQALYHFIWDDLCDWYLEVIKPRFYDNKGGAASKAMAQAALIRSLDTTLRLLHPFCPFVTEEIWASLRPAIALLDKKQASAECLAIAPWPKADKAFMDAEAKQRFAELCDIVRSIRNIRAEHNVEPKRQVPAIVSYPDTERAGKLDDWQKAIITALCKLSELKAGAKLDKVPGAGSAVVGAIEVSIPLADAIDPEMEKKRLVARVEKLKEQTHKLKMKLENQSYIERAPKELVEESREMLRKNVEELGRLERNVEELMRSPAK
ncbi:MAG: valine--tRNA ligase [Planctomycetaceae bacterium]|nr:valine--tRNA ligase [Planctomycetaceae bacterium]